MNCSLFNPLLVTNSWLANIGSTYGVGVGIPWTFMTQGTGAQLEQLPRTGRNICSHSLGHLWLSFQGLFRGPQILLKISSGCQTPERLPEVLTVGEQTRPDHGTGTCQHCLGGHCQCLCPWERSHSITHTRIS